MKHKRIPALFLAAVLCVGVLASTALAADTDAQSQATAKSAQEDKQQEKTKNDAAARDGEVRTRKAKKEEAAEPEGAIGKDAAREKALSDAGLTEEQVGRIRARVSDSDGTTVYKVRFTCDGQKYSYQIDAMTGAILDKRKEAAEKDGGSGCGRHGRRRNRQEAESTQASV